MKSAYSELKSNSLVSLALGILPLFFITSIGCGNPEPAAPPKNSFNRFNASANDRKKIGDVCILIHNCNNMKKRFPFVPEKSFKRHPSLSWRVSALECSNKYSRLGDQFDLNQKWDSERNKAPIELGRTIFSLENGSLISSIKADQPYESFAKMLDGVNETIILIENPQLTADDWTQANDLTVDEAIKLIRKISPGNYLAASLADGQVVGIPYLDPDKISDDDIRRLFNPADGRLENSGDQRRIDELIDKLETSSQFLFPG